MRGAVVFLIKAYRFLLSPWLGMHCRFAPTCSAYAQEAVMTHGTVKGLYMAIRRILRCHPFAPGGYDPVAAPRNARDKMAADDRKHNDIDR